MTYFADLTPYTYFHPEEDRPGTLNIGWLDRWHPFPIGEAGAEFQAKLKKLCDKAVKATRGFHCCPFCKGRNKPRSSAEIRVQGRGKVYAAPVLLHHYVVTHGYGPPQEFIDAVVGWEEDGGGGC
jgi:hypothetical protein